jgi:6-phosphogluconolactonase
MSDEIEWWDYDDAAEMAQAVAGDVQFIIESAIDARGAAVIALPGGNTPKPIYEILTKAGSGSRSSPPTSASCRSAIRCRTSP